MENPSQKSDRTGICKINGTGTAHTEDTSFEEDLERDVLEIITVFSARLYGARSRKNAKLLERMAKAVTPDGKEQEATE
jgi:predicted site-specific integrase-resolvase